MTYEVRLSPAARRSLTKRGTRARDAAVAFIYGPLAENPHRVGHPLREPFAGQHAAYRADYRVTCRIVESQILVEVVRVAHRSDIYRA